MNWFARLMGYDQENADRAAEADRKLAELNREKYERGEWTDEQYEAIEVRRITSNFDPDSEVWGGFEEGLSEGADNIKGTVKGTLNAAGGLVFGSIPWWVWLVGAALLFFWMGGGALLKGRLAR